MDKLSKATFLPCKNLADYVERKINQSQIILSVQQKALEFLKKEGLDTLEYGHPVIFQEIDPNKRDYEIGLVDSIMLEIQNRAYINIILKITGAQRDDNFVWTAYYDEISDEFKLPGKIFPYTPNAKALYIK